MSLCPQNKRNEGLEPRLRLNAYTIIVSFFLHLLCGIAFLMSQGHLATGNSFIVFGVASSQAQRVFFKTPQVGNVGTKKQSQLKPEKKNKKKKRKEKKKASSKKAPKKNKKEAKKKSFPEKPEAKKNKKKNVLPEKKSEKQEKASEEIKKEPEKKEEIIIVNESELVDPEVVTAIEVVPVVEEIAELEKTVDQVLEKIEEAALDDSDEFGVVVGADQGDYGDAVVVNVQRYLPFVQREIYRLWNPPVGVGLGTKAILKIAVNPSGKIDDFEIVTPSGCLIFDMSIERIADKFAFDACLWGKTFTVEFRQ